jgi:sialate O-acetylesterase
MLALLGLLLFTSSSVEAFSLSNTLGDHMVLQRAPQQAVVWGFAASGVTVTTTFNNQNYNSVADTTGVWRQTLPATPAGGPYNLTFKATDGGTGSLSDVLFGDVYIASGQSNMQFTVSLANNASNEEASADSYPNIRVFSVGDGTSSTTPLTQLTTILQRWAASSRASVGGPDWQYQTAVGWFFARGVYNSQKVPIGLINNNWGGTNINQWSSATANQKCNQTGSGNLWNAMVVPYTVGPMTLKGVVWYQGENNIGAPAYYNCAQAALIDDWRLNFKSANLWFAVVQLAGYNYGAGTGPGDFRIIQLTSLAQNAAPTGYSTAIDVGIWANIHPTDKQTVSGRLVNSALVQVYGLTTLQWKCPTVSSTNSTVSGTTVTVEVRFEADSIGTGLTTTVPAYALAVQANVCPSGATANECGYPAIEVNNGGTSNTVLNATATLTSDSKGMLLTATAPGTGYKAVKSSYGRASWPRTIVFNSNGCPVLPWYQ